MVNDFPAGRVVIVTPRYLPLLGGMEQQVKLLSTEMVRRGLNVVILTELLDASPRRESVAGLTIIRLGKRRNRRYPSEEKRSIFEQARSGISIMFQLFCLRHNTQFVMVRMVTLPALVTGLLRMTGLLRCPTIVVAEAGGDLDETTAFLRMRLQFFLCHVLRANNWFNALYSQHKVNFECFGINPSQIIEVRNGIDVELWFRRRQDKQKNRFIYFGRLDKRKGLKELLLAFKELLEIVPSAYLEIIGDGPMGAEIETWIADAQLESSIGVLAAMDHEELVQHVSVASCYVLPSYGEAFPLAPLEAAACGCQIILTDVVELQADLGDSVHYCRPADQKSLTAALLSAIQHEKPAINPEVVETWGIRHVVDEFVALASRPRASSLSGMAP